MILVPGMLKNGFDEIKWLGDINTETSGYIADAPLALF